MSLSLKAAEVARTLPPEELMSLSLEAANVARSLPLDADRSDVLRAAYDAIPEPKRRPRRWRDKRRLFYRACLSKHAILQRKEADDG